MRMGKLIWTFDERTLTCTMYIMLDTGWYYSKTCVKRLLKNRQNKDFMPWLHLPYDEYMMTNCSLMKVKRTVWSILQCFRPALSDNWSWKPIFGLFESGRVTQVLLYHDCYTETQNCLDKVTGVNFIFKSGCYELYVQYT